MTRATTKHFNQIPENNEPALDDYIVGVHQGQDQKFKVQKIAGLINAPVQSVAGKTGNVTLVKGDVGLPNVDNTSDQAKPVSTATQVAIAAETSRAQSAEATISTVVMTEAGVRSSTDTALQSSIDAEAAARSSADAALSSAVAGKYTKPGTGIPKADLATPVQAALDAGSSAVQSVNGKTGSSVTLNKTDVGLSNVDNTSDASKPVSTAQAAADSSVASTAQSNLDKSGAAITVDTTLDQAVDVTLTWDSASTTRSIKTTIATNMLV